MVRKLDVIIGLLIPSAIMGGILALVRWTQKLEAEIQAKIEVEYQQVVQRANAGDKEARQMLTQSTYKNLGEQLISLREIEDNLKQAHAILQKKSPTMDDVSVAFQILNRVQVDVAKHEKEWKVDLHGYINQITQALGKLAEAIEASKKSK